jgi:putative FmdB family regulatory protein
MGHPLDGMANVEELLMPIYEYECCNCHHIAEQLHITLDAKVCGIIICPICGHIADKIISTTSFRLKGGGWAKDNYSSSKKED